jgi:hypothetical protein
MMSNKSQYDAIKRTTEAASQATETVAATATRELEKIKKLKVSKTLEASLSKQHTNMISNLSAFISTITSDIAALDEIHPLPGKNLIHCMNHF